MLPLQDNICLDHRYWLGSFRDHSRNYSNHGVPSGVSWEKNRAGHFVRFKGTDLITVADSPEIQLDRGTIIVYGDFKDYASLDRLVSKRDAGGTNYELYFNGTSTITLYDGSNTRNATVSWAGSKYIAVSFSSGEKARAYIDGVYTTEFSDTSVFVKDDAVLYIGNYRTGVFPQSNPYKGVIIYDTVLTDSQIATAYQYTQTETTSISLPKKNFFIPSQINPHEPNLVAAYGMVNIGQKIIELASGGNDGDIIGCMGTLGPAGNALWFNGVSNLVSIPAGWHTDINTSNEFTFSASVKIDNLAGHNHRIFANNEGSGLAITISNVGAIQVFLKTDNTGWSSVTSAGLIIERVTNYINTTYKDGELKVYLNGNVIINSSSFTGGLSFISSVLYIGVNSSFNNHWMEGEIAEVKIYNKALTQNEISAQYKKYARLPVYYDSLEDALESISTVSSGYLGGTGWYVVSGSFKIVRDDSASSPGKKVIECITNGTLLQKGIQGASNAYTKTFEQVAGSPTLTKNTSSLELVMVSGEKVGEILLTVGEF